MRHDIPWLMLYIMVMRMSKASESHDHQLNEEEDEDRHETDALHPRVLCDRPCQTFVGQGFIGGC
jgi:hypothetical protein